MLEKIEFFIENVQFVPQTIFIPNMESQTTEETTILEDIEDFFDFSTLSKIFQ